MISWTGQSTEVLLNPRLPRASRDSFMAMAAEGPPGLIWLATSGSEGHPSLVGHSREGLLASAAAVNRHLECTDRDVWANLLPTCHVGGLGLVARAWLAGGRLVGHRDEGLPPPWDPAACLDLLAREGATITSMVPTQVHDLVAAGFESPPSLRAVVVGGAALSPRLRARGRELGWPLLPSYGATECGSQVATAPLLSLSRREYPELRILSHCRVRVEKGRLSVRSDSLHLARVDRGGLEVREGDWWLSPDQGEVAGSYLVVKGRRSDFIKVGGEGVHLAELQPILEEVLAGQGEAGRALLLPWPDERLGTIVGLVAEGIDPDRVMLLRQEYDRRVLPPARARTMFVVDRIPLTMTGKPDRAALLELLQGGDQPAR